MEGVERGTLFATKHGPSSLAALKEHRARHAFLSVLYILSYLFWSHTLCLQMARKAGICGALGGLVAP